MKLYGKMRLQIIDKQSKSSQIFWRFLTGWKVKKFVFSCNIAQREIRLPGRTVKKAEFIIGILRGTRCKMMWEEQFPYMWGNTGMLSHTQGNEFTLHFLFKSKSFLSVRRSFYFTQHSLSIETLWKFASARVYIHLTRDTTSDYSIGRSAKKVVVECCAPVLTNEWARKHSVSYSAMYRQTRDAVRHVWDRDQLATTTFVARRFLYI